MEPAARPRHPAAQQLAVRPPESGETWPLTDVYLELVWAHRLGPSATLAARHIGRHLERYPNGGTLNLDTLAKSIGLSRPDAPSSPEVGRDSTIAKSIQRLAYFSVLEWSPDDATITTSGKDARHVRTPTSQRPTNRSAAALRVPRRIGRYRSQTRVTDRTRGESTPVDVSYTTVRTGDWPLTLTRATGWKARPTT